MLWEFPLFYPLCASIYITKNDVTKCREAIINRLAGRRKDSTCSFVCILCIYKISISSVFAYLHTYTSHLWTHVLLPMSTSCIHCMDIGTFLLYTYMCVITHTHAFTHSCIATIVPNVCNGIYNVSIWESSGSWNTYILPYFHTCIYYKIRCVTWCMSSGLYRNHWQASGPEDRPHTWGRFGQLKWGER